MKEFLEKFNRETRREYEQLRCREVVVLPQKETVLVSFVYPENTKLTQSDEERINIATIRILNTALKVQTKFLPSHFDKDNFTKELLEFFSNYPLLDASIKSSELNFLDNSSSVKIFVNEDIYKYIEEKEILTKLDEHFSLYYCQEINICFALKEEESQEEGGENARVFLQREGGRFITPTNVDNFVGRPIYSKASYIKDATTAKDEVTLCGTIDSIGVVEYKDKKTGEPKKFYKIMIFDFTGRLEFIYFPNKYSKDKIDLLKAGKDILIRGELKLDAKYGTRLSMIARDISYCTIPKDSSENKLILSCPNEYKAVKPQRHTETKQVDLFSSGTEAVNQKLIGKAFVVFDLETTGLDPKNSTPIELGAVKIVDGKITETLHTLIDPKVPIPPEITKHTGITDDMVRGKPILKPVLEDFYKFSFNLPLVAHNIDFDLSFLKAYGETSGLNFDRKTYCTLDLSRKLVKGVTKNHKLTTLLDYFNINIENAHRALDDALATARLFIKLVDLT